jgi:hypothetical protein
MSGKNNEGEASFAEDESEDEEASSEEEEEEVIAETQQPAQPPEQPILASPITGGARYQFRSTPDRLNASHRVQQRYPFVDAATRRVLNSSVGSAGATATTRRIASGGGTSVRTNATTTSGIGESNVSRSVTSNTTNTATAATSASESVAATINNADSTTVTINNATARASRSQSTSKGARTKGMKNFGNDDIQSMLDLIEKVLPTGNEFWELVADLHKERFSATKRNAVSIIFFFTNLQMKNLAQETPQFHLLHLRPSRLRRQLT